MGVLVDTSIWIDYFKGGEGSSKLDHLIDENIVLINEIILAELIPYLQLKKQYKVIKLLREINTLPLSVDWNEIIEYQAACLKSSANGIGLPDLIIGQNALINNVSVYSLDEHFKLMNKILAVEAY